MDQDLEHLRLLSIFHYVVGGLAALFACLPLAHLFIGVALVAGAGGDHARLPAMLVGWLLVAFAGAWIGLGWALAVCLALAGSYLAHHTHYTFCLVMAGLACAFAPLGTVLGVLTLVVLLRSSARSLFTAEPAR